MTVDRIRIEALLRGSGTRRGLFALLRELGFRPDPLRLQPEDVGFAPGDPVVGVVRVANRGSLDVLWIRLQGDIAAEAVGRLSRTVRQWRPLRQTLFVFTAPGDGLAIGSFGLDGVLRHLCLETSLLRGSDAEAVAEMVAEPGEEGLALVQRYARALDRTRVTRRFFADFRAHRAAIAAAWSGIPEDDDAERQQLALLQLCRLMFLYFLQRRQHLAGDPEFLRGLLRRLGSTDGSFFRGVLQPLFFGSLNTRPEARETAARDLGDLPYLNGGLFDRHALEHRFADLDLPDDVLRSAMDDFLERYRFTPLEAADAAAGGGMELGVDPEMLGRVFEGLMAPERRGDTGTFYTPPPVVDRLVRESLATWIESRAGVDRSAAERAADGVAIPGDATVAVARALQQVRVLDPACGSGAFLLGALARIANARAGVEGATSRLPALRRDVLAGSIYGVDLQEDAALLCALRLWLAVSCAGAGDLLPLPNLDRSIRQGDTLLDPLDLLRQEDGDPAWRSGTADDEVRQAVARIQPLAAGYLSAGPESRAELARRLATEERRLAGAWLALVERRVRHAFAEASSVAHARDLFGDTLPESRRAALEAKRQERRLDEVRRMRVSLNDGAAAPFFSFDVHFANTRAAGFDLVVSNPPWVRSHRWPAAVARLVRSRSEICGGTAPHANVEKSGRNGGQVDLSLLFLERSLRLLSPGGVSGMVLPAKLIRSLYAGGARRMMLRDCDIAYLEDHSLDQRSIFRADAFATLLVVRRRAMGSSPAAAPESVDSSGFPCLGVDKPKAVQVTMIRRGGGTLRFRVANSELPLLPDDPGSPWLIVPEGVRAAIRRMQSMGTPLGSQPGLQIRRGVETGRNAALVLHEVRHGIGDLARFKAEGWTAAGSGGGARQQYGGVIESAAIRPLLRGTDLRPWCCRTERWVIAPEDPRRPPPRAAAYLSGHDVLPPSAPRGVEGGRVGWRDIGRTLEAAIIPTGIVPLNTVYYLTLTNESHARRLCAILNSLPARVFARAVAERGKDAHFRFFAWTMALLPLPADWGDKPDGAGLEELAAEAEAGAGLSASAQRILDEQVARMYDLRSEELTALSDFDEWLSGRGAADG